MNDNSIDKRDKIINLVKVKGPLLPVQITKEIDANIMFASAFLSELVASGKIKITNVKLGGSPFYYVSGQEPKLEGLIKYLNEKDRNTVQILKSKKILRDSQCTPFERVSLRQIKDYARPIQVRLDDGNVEIFWRWHLVNEDEAKSLIKNILEGEVSEGVDEAKEEIIDNQFREEVKIEKQKQLVEEAVQEPVKEKKIRRDELGFYNKVMRYFKSKDIEIVNESTVKKGREFNFIIDMDSNIGKMRFFVKCKDKRKINDGDLSLALNEAKGLPVLFLTNGELSKGLEKQIEFNFKGISFRKIS